MEESPLPTIVIAGASGFIGRWFIDRYHKKYRIIGLSRSEVKNRRDNVEWRKVDLFSLSSTVEALREADYALYLVHSMMPSTRLNQSSFEDTDLLLADNFARAAELAGLRQIIFMGGILPKETEDFSPHLRSRLETEKTLGSRATPLTALRAGIIIGPGGSSFRIVEKLVDNLPIMACPKWCNSPSQPIDIEDVLDIIGECLGNEKTYNQSIEIGGNDIISYMDLMKMTAEEKGARRLMMSLPFFTLGFSKLWVSVFSDSSITFVSPLIESLKHEMLVDENQTDYFNKEYVPIRDSVRKALKKGSPKVKKKPKTNLEQNTVRSVQRLSNPSNKSVEWVASSYPNWLSKKLRFFFKAEEKDDLLTFKLFNISLLILQFVHDRSDDNRHLFFIVGGALVKRRDYGWLEFRSVLENRFIIAAIHEFVPRLPWILYRYSQAVVHLFIMNSFARFVEKQ